MPPKAVSLPPLPFRYCRLLITKDLGIIAPKEGLKRRRRVLARCDCGKVLELNYSGITSGTTKSCGCLRDEGRQDITTHGYSHTTGYKAWKGMKARCTDLNHASYGDYGGRGIGYDPRWEEYANFLKDMGERPDGLTLERSNNNLGYSKDNCIWATYTTQARNTRRNRLITYKGETLCLQAWADKLGIKRELLSYRLTNWPIEAALKGI